MNKSEAHDRLVRQLIVELSKTGICRVWQQPTGAAYRGDFLIRYGLVGSADISGILISGRRLEIEVKTGKGVQTDRQKSFQRMIQGMGGLYIVARDIESVVEQVKSATTYVQR